jgi:uncharacterized protein
MSKTTNPTTKTKSESIKDTPKQEKVKVEATVEQANLPEDQRLVVILSLLSMIFGLFVVPLIIYFVSENKLVKEHMKPAINFGISLCIYYTVFGIVASVSTALFFLIIPILTAVLGWLGVVAVGLMQLILPIIAVIKFNENKDKIYKYPLTIKFI